MKQNITLVILATAAAATIAISLQGIKSTSRSRPALHNTRLSSSDGPDVADAVTPLAPVSMDAGPSKESSIQHDPVLVPVAPPTAAHDVDRPQQQWVSQMREVARGFSVDSTSLAEAVARLKTESDPEQMALLAQAIAESAATANSRLPVADLLQMAAGDEPASRREAALHILSRLTYVTPETMAIVANITTSDPAPEMRIAGINTMGGWMAQNRALTETVSIQLSRAITAEPSEQVRSFAIQAIANQDAALSGEVFQTLVTTMRNEPAPSNRALAALALGGGETADTRPLILQELKAAYLKEADLDTQRNILTQIARAGKSDAVPLLQQLPAPHPYLAQDANDYMELLQTVDTWDFDRIWDTKSRRDLQRGSILGATPADG